MFSWITNSLVIFCLYKKKPRNFDWKWYKRGNKTHILRFCLLFQGVELYSYHKAKGLHLLNVINKNCYSHKDSYWAHTALSYDGKHVALVTFRYL